MKEFKHLIDVKSIVTLVMTLAVVFLSVTGQMEIKDIYLIIMAFYFGTQTQKTKELVGRE